jgi:ferric-dicitrate binding protein FerR (iron transport regulator)
VIEFKPRRAARRDKRFRVMGPLEWLERQEDRRRILENLAAALVVALLVTTGLWLLNQLSAHSHLETCLDAGHHQECALARGSALHQDVR